MTAQDFDGRELSSMVGSDQSMELFNQRAGYLMSEHIRYQKMVAPPHMIKGGGYLPYGAHNP